MNGYGKGGKGWEKRKENGAWGLALEEREWHLAAPLFFDSALYEKVLVLVSGFKRKISKELAIAR